VTRFRLLFSLSLVTAKTLGERLELWQSCHN